MSEKLPRVMIDGSPPESLRKLLQPVELVPWQQRPSAELHDVVAIFTYQHPPVDGELMDALPNCKVISNHGVGVDHIDLAAATARNLPVGHTPDVLSGAVADLAWKGESHMTGGVLNYSRIWGHGGTKRWGNI